MDGELDQTESPSPMLLPDGDADAGTTDGDPVDVDSPDVDGGSSEPARPPVGPAIELDDAEHPARPVVVLLEALLVAGCSLLVFLTLHPNLILADTTPTGGDMGAHVWGPDYLRDVLLPQFRLAGWADAWYAGFPAYTFYMVLPALMIVALWVGPPVWLAPVLVTAVAAGTALLARRFRGGYRVWIIVAGVVLATLCIPMPYGVAFKLVAVSGLVSFPVSAWAFGRLAGAPFPIPPLLALGGMMFIYDSGKSTTITGGNMASTMAGEFSFSISLSLLLVFLGVFIRAVRTGRYIATAALLYGLVALAHVIPAIYGAIAAVIVVVCHLDVFIRAPRRLLALGIPPLAGLISGFWTVPFYLNRTYLNDMGWEKATEYGAYLWPGTLVEGQTEPLAEMLYRNVVFMLAIIGAILAIVHLLRIGWVLTGLVAAAAVGFVVMPQGRFWNLRILPLYRLGLYLLGAIAVGLVILSIAELWRLFRRERRAPVLPATVGLGLATLVVAAAILVPLHLAPGGRIVRTAEVAGAAPTSEYRWLGRSVTSTNNARSWAAWNFKGYEGAPGSGEFFAMVDTMRQVGEDRGCGRAMWEYGKFLDSYGTPMAPMLLPYFTDGCIGSMEGLFFEASATTPFHFLNQSELSDSPSRAMRDIPYSGFDIEQGVRHLQMLGVRYYMTYSEAATAAARDHGGLSEIASSNKWTVWEVPGSELVTGLGYEPAVWTDVDQGVHGWVLGPERPDPNDPTGRRKIVEPGAAVDWYNDPDQWDVMRAAGGPEEWQRIRAGDDPERRPVSTAEVTDIEQDDHRIAFRVDQPGSPVLVRASYFPNWRVSGAEGPYRVAPNLMVVVPTSEEVELTFGRSAVELLGWLLTLVGLLGAVLLSRTSWRMEAAAAATAASRGVAQPVPGEPVVEWPPREAEIEDGPIVGGPIVDDTGGYRDRHEGPPG